MNLLRVLALAAFALGALLTLGAIGLILSAQGPSSSGFDDLARIAGSLLLGLAAAAAFGTHLILTRRTQPPAWETGISLGGATLGLIAAAWVGLIALEGRNVWLLLVVALVIALAATGLVSGARGMRATQS